jgi:hypothetical protein
MPSLVDIDIYQGTEFDLRLVLKDSAGAPFNLSGYSARGQIKRRFSDASGICPLTVTPTSGFLASGYLDIFIAATGTVNLPVMQALYDIQIYDNSSYVEQFVKGYANIYPEVMLPY